MAILQRIRSQRFEEYVRDYHAVGCFPTHDGLTLISVLWPSSRFQEIRTDIEGHVRKALESTPTVAERLQHARREERWVGTAGVPSYFRRPFGPGWALVGDAAYDKDPITAQGISDAFIDADGLAAALDDGWSGRRPLDAARDTRSGGTSHSKPRSKRQGRGTTIPSTPRHWAGMKVGTRSCRGGSTSSAMLVKAYRQFEERVGVTNARRGAKRDMIRDAVKRLPSRFRYADIERAPPAVSRPTIARALRELRTQGAIRCVKPGRDATWEKREPTR